MQACAKRRSANDAERIAREVSQGASCESRDFTANPLRFPHAARRAEHDDANFSRGCETRGARQLARRADTFA
jgi:hypothetical protein